MMKGFKNNIEKETLDNPHFRKVLYTGKHTQLVVMTLQPGEDIGLETHPEIDQFFRVEGGHGKCLIDDNVYIIKDSDAIVVPAGSKHNFINTSATELLQVYTLYSPPNHKDGTVHQTKEDAEASDEKFDGKTTE